MDINSRTGRPQRPAHLLGAGAAALRPPVAKPTRVLGIQPWDEVPPPTAKNFFAQELDNLLLPAGAGAQITTTTAGGGALQLPPNTIGVIKSVSWFASGPTTDTNIFFTVRVNRRPILGLTRLKFPPQNAGAVNFALEGTWDLPAGAFLDVLIENRNAFGPWLVNFTLVGWSVARPDATQWTGQDPGQI